MLVCPGEERGALCASQIYIIIIKGLSLLQSIEIFAIDISKMRGEKKDTP